MIQKEQNTIFAINLVKSFFILKDLIISKSITKTANNLRQSPSSISRNVRQIENLFKIKIVKNHGTKGISFTTEGKTIVEMYGQQLINTTEQLFEQIANNNDVQTVRLSAHPLATQAYIMPSMEKLIKTNKTHYINTQIIEETKEDAIDKLRHNLLDVIIYPLENEKLKYFDRSNYIVKQCKEYQLILYAHKKHPIANKIEQNIVLTDLDNANIAPTNQSVRFDFFQKIIDIDKSKPRLNTSTIDLLLLYRGIQKNKWCVGIGKEFEQIFDCTQLAKKEYSKTSFFTTKYYWYIIAKNKHKNQAYKKLIEQIAKSLTR